MTDEKDKELTAGLIKFHDYYVPSLEAGEYNITVKQTIKGSGINETFQPQQPQLFEVRAPQFALDPTEIHSLYPPRQSTGVYDTILPHIVLNKRILPWERALLNNELEKKLKAPWMALLIFQEDELNLDPKTNSPLIVSTVEKFLEQKCDTAKPGIDPENLHDDVKKMNCQSVILPYRIFYDLAPHHAGDEKEMCYMAHVRQVNTGDQEIDGLKDRGWYAVLTANRFPQSTKTGAKNYAMLVSLEGLADYLEGNPAVTKPNIQVLVLKSWTFTSTAEKGESFAELMNHFVEQEGENPQNIMLRFPGPAPPSGSPSNPSEEAAQRLWNGYVPVSYHTSTGEDTYAWYRGPLTPVIARKLPKETAHFTTGSEAMIYDREFGIFDHSYAAAFQIGRAMALADKSFAVSLLNLRRSGHRLINRLIQRLHSQHTDTSQDFGRILRSDHVRKSFDRLLEKNNGSRLTALFRALNADTGAMPSPVRAVPPKAAPGETLVDIQRNFQAEKAVQHFMQGSCQEELEPVVEWLAKLNLLYGVPFVHLVPDDKMLPVESIRFFYLDQNWTDTLVDGALSVGIATSRDSLFQKIMKNVIDDALNSEIRKLRARIGGTATGDIEADSSKEARSGFLIRSALVSGWPGLAVKAFQDDKPDKPLKLLRLDRLSSDVLLALFLDVPDTVELSEPPQTLRFGVERDENNDLYIQMRSLENQIGNPEKRFCLGKDSYRNIETRVLDLTSLVGKLGGEFKRDRKENPLGPAEFAVQMVKAPERLTFKRQ